MHALVKCLKTMAKDVKGFRIHKTNMLICYMELCRLHELRPFQSLDFDHEWRVSETIKYAEW